MQDVSVEADLAVLLRMRWGSAEGPLRLEGEVLG